MFSDRLDAGIQLGERLQHLKGEDLVVLGLPRGGVPVAFQVAKALAAPLDVIVVRKLGVPFQPELAMGAVGEGGVRVLNEDVVSMSGVTSEQLTAVEAREREELERRAVLFRHGHPRVSLVGRVAVIVDDGIATGSTARAAAQVARALGATRVVVTAPVAPRGVNGRLAGDADEVIVVDTPDPFYAIGEFYRDFTQTSDAEVSEWLDRASVRSGADHPSLLVGEDPSHVDIEVEVLAGGHRLGGHLTIPERTHGVVVFAHGSGSSRHSPRNRQVAEALNTGGLGTLLFDLLTPEEGLDRSNVFDIELLAGRLMEAVDWLTGSRTWSQHPIGFFGSSTGAAAALWAASEIESDLGAVVSRGGRPDLASAHLARVKAPTLLIVGSRDPIVLDLNRAARDELRCESSLEVIPDAGHLFEEPGALDQVARLARDWFTVHFRAWAVSAGSHAGSAAVGVTPNEWGSTDRSTAGGHLEHTRRE